MSQLKKLKTPERHIKVLWLAWSLLGLAGVAMTWFPIRFGMLVALMVALLLMWWSLTLALCWRHKVLRAVALGVTASIVLFLLAPGRAVDTAGLSRAYVQSLQKYEGVEYVWGGETARGIDCSGLIRRGLIDANWQQGWRTLNPALVRQSINMWWHDCSAKALKEEYRGWTQTLFTSNSLNTLDATRLQAGDIAVTSNGVHTLAYLGNNTWIEADPKAWKVLRLRTPTDNAWFNLPVHLLRWTQLDNKNHE